MYTALLVIIRSEHKARRSCRVCLLYARHSSNLPFSLTAQRSTPLASGLQHSDSPDQSYRYCALSRRCSTHDALSLVCSLHFTLRFLCVPFSTSRSLSTIFIYYCIVYINSVLLVHYSSRYLSIVPLLIIPAKNATRIHCFLFV